MHHPPDTLRAAIARAMTQDFPTTHSDRFNQIVDRVADAVEEFWLRAGEPDAISVETLQPNEHQR